jgi:FMN-dependent NADH-azoreductase
MDFAAPYLRAIFGFVGITDVEIVRAEAQADPIAGAASLEKAIGTARLLA